MKIKSSPELLAFYRWWIENKDEIRALKSFGLCVTAKYYYPEGDYALQDELISQFSEAGLNADYPFGHENYAARKCYDTMHLDPLRIAWVEARIADMED